MQKLSVAASGQEILFLHRWPTCDHDIDEEVFSASARGTHRVLELLELFGNIGGFLQP